MTSTALRLTRSVSQASTYFAAFDGHRYVVHKDRDGFWHIDVYIRYTDTWVAGATVGLLRDARRVLMDALLYGPLEATAGLNYYGDPSGYMYGWKTD